MGGRKEKKIRYVGHLGAEVTKTQGSVVRMKGWSRTRSPILKGLEFKEGLELALVSM